jgi:membrane-associated phospholipid phosphatase
MKEKLAKIISIIGHPFLTISLFVFVVLFLNSNAKSASFLTFLIIGCIVIPLVVSMFVKTKKGIYTNFDVSDRKERYSLFSFALPLLFIVTTIVFLTKQPRNICLSLLFASIIVIVSWIVNFFIKSSLHVSLTLFLGFLAIPINTVLGIFFLALSIPVGWSRIILKRHTLKEVITGAAIGLLIGCIMLYFLHLKV